MADHEQKHFEPIGVLFQSREEARAAIKALHKSKYTHTWMGTTSVAAAKGGEVVTVEKGGFFAGTESLVDSLVSHGIHGDTARHLEQLVEPGNALLTLDPKDRDPQEALAIIESHGGQGADVRSAAGWPGWATPMGTTGESDYDVDAGEWEELEYSRS